MFSNAFQVVSYHELKDNTAPEMKRIMQHCQLDFGEGFQVCSFGKI